jgi:hypothetical protein
MIIRKSENIATVRLLDGVKIRRHGYVCVLLNQVAVVGWMNKDSVNMKCCIIVQKEQPGHLALGIFNTVAAV